MPIQSLWMVSVKTNRKASGNGSCPFDLYTCFLKTPTKYGITTQIVIRIVMKLIIGPWHQLSITTLSMNE